MQEFDFKPRYSILGPQNKEYSSKTLAVLDKNSSQKNQALIRALELLLPYFNTEKRTSM